jgi:hypothetical protein
MHGKPLGDVVMALRGPKGTRVKMVVQQPGQAKRTAAMERGVVPIASVKGIAEKGETDWEYALPGQKRIAYVEMTDLSGSTAAEWATAARQIERQGFEGLVLDLRNCGQADIHHARMVADALISAPWLGEWTDAHGKTTRMRLRASSLLPDLPIRLIVSAAQVNEVKLLVEALVLHRGAEIIGSLNPMPVYIRGNLELPSGAGALENVYIGVARVERAQRENGAPSDSGRRAAFPKSTGRFRAGAREIDQRIQQAAQSLLERLEFNH